MNLLSKTECGDHVYYMVWSKRGKVYNRKDVSERFDKKNIEDYIRPPENIGGGLLMFSETTSSITIVVYAMQKDSKGKYRPKEGDKIIKIFTSP